MRSMSTNLTERVEVMVERAAERVERVWEKERVVGIGVAAMVKGRVGVIVRSLLVSLNNLVCTAQVVVSVLKMSLKLLSILCFPNPVFLMVMLLASTMTRISFVMSNKRVLNGVIWPYPMYKTAGVIQITRTTLIFTILRSMDQKFTAWMLLLWAQKTLVFTMHVVSVVALHFFSFHHPVTIVVFSP